MTDKLLEFHSEGVPDGTLRVRHAEGTEEISGLYRFELEMFAKKDFIDPAAVIQAPAWLAVKPPPVLAGRKAGRTVKLHGILSAFEQLEKHNEWVRYRAVLVPRLWKLTLTRRNRAFRDKTMSELISLLLRPLGINPTVSLSGTHPTRPYVAQYQESDFAFLSRWLEHEGILYFFDHSGSQEAVTFADSSAVHKPIEGEPAVDYEPSPAPAAVVAKEGTAEGVVLAFGCRSRALPQEVVLCDWDEREVQATRTTAAVDSRGFGKVFEYGFHPENASHAQALAKARAEALKCRGKVFSGTGGVRPFRSGFLFDLKKHYQFNGKYLITRVTHTMSQPLDIPKIEDLPAVYSNRFEGIPSDVPFRPERVTPWPKIHGFADAIVTSGKEEGGRKHADVDENGAYRLNMNYDEGDDGRPAGTHPVRMAQPHAGESHGMHFPLHANTEVVVGHKDGDPDRPVILSAVPNPRTKSPVLRENTTQCVVRSSSQNIIRLEDKKDGEDFFLHASKDMNVRVVNDHLLTVGHDSHTTVGKDKFETIAENLNEAVGKDCLQTVEQNLGQTIGQNHQVSVGQDQSVTVGGNRVDTIGGNHLLEAGGKTGLKAVGIVLEATAGITLVCGSNSIVISAAGVTITGKPAVTIDGAMTKINSGPGASPEQGPSVSKQDPAKAEKAKEATT